MHCTEQGKNEKHFEAVRAMSYMYQGVPWNYHVRKVSATQKVCPQMSIP